MHRITQKLQAYGASLLLTIVGLTIPLLISSPASAATMQPKGTCFMYIQGQTPSPKIGLCSKIAKGIRDDNGKPSTTSGTKLSASKCYEITEGLSSQSITEVQCDGTDLPGKKAPIQMCDDNGVSQACEYCTDGTLAPNNDPTQCSKDGGKCASLSKCDLITKYVNPLINFLAALVGVAVVISLIIGGIQYGSSAGDPAKVSAAKNRIRNAIIALVTFIFLWALLNFLIPGGLT